MIIFQNDICLIVEDMHSINLSLILSYVKKYFQFWYQFLLAAPINFHYVFLILSIGFLIGLIDFFNEFFVLKINDVFTFQIWKLFTNVFIEPNILIFLWAVFCSYQLVAIIEPIWGLIEIFKYLAIIQFFTTISISVFTLLIFILFKELNLLYFVKFCGFSTFAVSSLVALKQFIPDTVVLTTFYGRLKIGHLPLTAFIISLFFWLFGILRGGVPIQIAFGLQISWTYLRFIRTTKIASTETSNSENEDRIIYITGDESEHFIWASFFPRKTQRFANIIGNIMFRFLAFLKICKKFRNLDLSKFETTIQETLESFDNRDSERKRQRALRMLNERLSSVASTGKRSDIMEMSLKVLDNQKTSKSFQQPAQESTISTNNKSISSTLVPISLPNADEIKSISSTSPL